MTRDECATQLETLFQASAAESADIVVCLSTWPQKKEESLTYHINSSDFIRNPSKPVNATFFFSSWEKMFEILTGSADPIKAFMQGEFRSDGHLTTIFLLLSVFSGSVRLETPK